MVEILCTITGVVAGVAIVASLVQARGNRSRWQAAKEADDELQKPAQIQGIADQLRLLTFRVAADVTAHTEKVEAINGRLNDPNAAQPAQILSAINELVSANEAMQTQLAEARKRIADQTCMIDDAALQARTDALTGLANRRAFNEFLWNCLNALQPGELAGLLLLDLDELKSFNDTYGYTTGDAMLSAFARNVKKFCNQECFPARYDGGQFAVVITARDANSLAGKAASIRKLASEQLISHEGAQLKLTASGGLSMLAAGDTLQTATDRSKVGLQRAKKAGRNQGFWLNGKHWQPFPSIEVARGRDAAPDAQTVMRQSIAALERKGEPSTTKADTIVAPRAAPQYRADTTTRDQHHAEVHTKVLGDVLDLPGFIARTTVYFDQLRRAELPATGMLVSAHWKSELEPSEAKACWTSVLGLIQSQLRGIDIICDYRTNTAGVFLPGCSVEAAAERASRIQVLLEDSRDEWQPHNQCPERLSISIAQALEDEETTQFLQRMELALSQAQEGGRFELAIHDGRIAKLESSMQV